LKNPTKHDLRTTYQQRRAGIDMQAWDHHVASALKGWATWRSAAVIGGYVALGDEPSLPQHPGLVVPRASGRGFVYAQPHGAMHAGVWGVPEPGADAPMVPWDEIDLVIVPGLAFDLSGRRLGRGGGVYDRALAQLPPGTARVGVAHPDLIADILPSEPHDVAMTHLIIGHKVVATRPPHEL
jgi:5-formyltetrahydrofolate cyclo-ligase